MVLSKVKKLNNENTEEKNQDISKKELIMRHIFIIYLLLLSSMQGFADRIVPLPKVLRPHSMAVDSNQLYICEGPVISIYSLEDFSLTRKFGGKGEGPMEFKGSISVNCRTDRLIISSRWKISHYKKNGDYIKEMKIPSPFYSGFEPLKNQYVAMEDNFKDTQKIILCDSNLEKTKNVHENKNVRKRGDIFSQPLIAHTSKDRIFLAASRDFVIDVFDINLKRLFTIKTDYELINITENYKRELLESYRKSPVTKEFYKHFKKIVKFPSHFPAIRNFFVEDGKIYICTYKTSGNKTEFYIFDESGKFRKSVFLPVIDKEFMVPAIYRIKNGKLYLLFENEDEEEWELRISVFD